MSFDSVFLFSMALSTIILVSLDINIVNKPDKLLGLYSTLFSLSTLISIRLDTISKKLDELAKDRV
jgi:hypothetical protein